MTKQRSMILSVAVAALSLGVAGGITLAAEDAPATGADDSSSAGESAKMGKEEGTHVGPGLGITPGKDTSKIDQPPRKSPYTTGGDTPPATSDQTGE